MSQPDFFAGMKVVDLRIQQTPVFPERMRFSVASPVLVKKFDGTSIRHLTFNDPEANDVMTKTMQTKLRTAGLDAHAETVRVSFDTSYTGAKTKLVDIHGIKNRANVCPVIVEGTPEAVAFAWDVGVGHSTGSGFGALR
jgi:CRISPR-associated endoribonuclease Cas6